MTDSCIVPPNLDLEKGTSDQLPPLLPHRALLPYAHLLGGPILVA